MAIHMTDEPGEVRARKGRVIVRCGPHCACELSPDDAVIMSDRLFRAGIRAKRQEKRRDEAE